MIRNWIWKGDLSESRRPLRALMLAPLIAAIPALIFFLFWIFGGGPNEKAGMAFLIVIGNALLVSYGCTLIYGLPVFLGLSRLGYAGLLPMSLMGALPGALLSIGNNKSDVALLLWLPIVCGIFIAGLFWFIARRA